MKRMSKEVVVVGGGAAGMMAAITAAEQGAQVRLLEPNERLGKKTEYHRKRSVQCDQQLPCGGADGTYSP